MYFLEWEMCDIQETAVAANGFIGAIVQKGQKLGGGSDTSSLKDHDMHRILVRSEIKKTVASSDRMAWKDYSSHG